MPADLSGANLTTKLNEDARIISGAETFEVALISARHDQKQIWSRLPAGFAASSFLFFYAGPVTGAIWLAVLSLIEVSGYFLKHFFIRGAYRLRPFILLNVLAVSICWIAHAAICWKTDKIIPMIATVMDLFTVSLYAVLGSFQDRRVMLLLLAPALSALSILLTSYLWTHAPPLMALFASISTIGACQLIVMNGLAMSSQHQQTIAATRMLRNSEKNYRTAAIAAEVAHIAKSEFLANVSHELRTPLTSIIGFGDLLYEDQSLNEKSRHYSSRVRDGGRSLLAIINDVLDYSEVERGKIVLSLSPCWIGDVAGEAIALLQIQAETKNIPIALQCEPELFVSQFLLDEKRFRQLLLNLVGNALKFSDTGKINVSLALPSHETLRCEVADNGPGISEDDQSLLFQRFSRLSTSLANDKGGTGLGLAICKGIVSAWNGCIGVVSQLGVGSTFWFEIPAPKAAGEHIPISLSAPQQIAGGKRVLLVDDNESVLQFVATALDALGIGCTQAQSGEEAVQIAQRERSDLVLMDIRMPGIGGIEAMKAIREKWAGAPFSIIAFTGEGDKEKLQFLLDEGFSSVLTKPVTVQSLRNCVVEFLGQSIDSKE